MTIKKRFLISYIGGIAIACLSLFSIICIAFYINTGKVPSPNALYKTVTQQRALNPEEELAYIKLREIAKSDPDQLLAPNDELKEMLERFEREGLGVVVRKETKMRYYSQNLVEKSLIAHFPHFDANNIKTRGTLDNAGRLYQYMKYDFHFKNGDTGSLLILKKDNNFLEFMTKWGVLVSLLILLIAFGGLLFLNHLLKQTIISPLENLGAGMSEIQNGHLAVSVAHPKVQAAMEVKQLTDDFEKMRIALLSATAEQVKLEENRKTLVASISHDLKTPITSIIGYVEGLLDGVATTPEKREKYLQTIHTKALSLNELIEALFLYSKLDAAAIPLNFERINLNEFLAHIIEEFQIQETDFSLQLTSQQTKASYVMADRIQLNRVFSNLIENSLKFQVPNRPLSIDLNLSDMTETLSIRVSDNGQGIPAEQLPFVFNHFYRGEVSRSTDTGGSGLGLAIVKQIIEMHEGQIMIESKSYQGTTVVITLKKA